MQEITVKFIYSRQQNMKNFYTQRPYWQNDMGGSDHCYILDAVTAVHVLTATNKQLYL